MNINNLRTISELTELSATPVNLVEMLLSNTTFFEIEKDNITYKISGINVYNAIKSKLEYDILTRFVTLATDQIITGKKTFSENGIIINDCNLQCYSSNNTSILSCNTPIDGIALSACWA